MIYVYPKLDGINLGFFRKGGCGLGNLLFTYARAYVYAKKVEGKLIWPTWMSINPSIIFSKENDKRLYNDLFFNSEKAISGIEKLKILLTKEKVLEKNIVNYTKKELDDKVVVFEGMDGCFDPIMYDSKMVKENIINCLREKNRKVLKADYSDGIMMHVRLGDFSRATQEQLLSGQHNSSIPIEWYCGILEEIRSITEKKVKCYVVSDGTKEELKPLLEKENVERVTWGTRISDILALSKAKLFIASGSSFSMWARYLGRMSVIAFPNQIKQKILCESDSSFEIEVLKDIPREYYSIIKNLF